MSNQSNPSSRQRREKQEERRAATKAQQDGSHSLPGTLSSEIGHLYRVLETLNQSTTHFCHIMNEQHKGLQGRITALTKSLDKSRGSSTLLGWMLIVVTLIGVLITVGGVFIGKKQLDVYTAQTRLMELQTEAIKHQSQNRPQWDIDYECIYWDPEGPIDIVSITNNGAAFQSCNFQKAVFLEISVRTGDHSSWGIDVPLLDYKCYRNWTGDKIGKVGDIQCHGQQTVSKILAEFNQMANREGLKPIKMNPMIYVRLEYCDMFRDSHVEYYKNNSLTEDEVQRRLKDDWDFKVRMRRLNPNDGKELFESYKTRQPEGLFLEKLECSDIRHLIEERLGKDILDPKIK